jgi:hypothetical protein
VETLYFDEIWSTNRSMFKSGLRLKHFYSKLLLFYARHGKHFHFNKVKSHVLRLDINIHNLKELSILCLCNANKFSWAYARFLSLPKPTNLKISTYNALFRGALRTDNYDASKLIYSRLRKSHAAPNALTYQLLSSLWISKPSLMVFLSKSMKSMNITANQWTAVSYIKYAIMFRHFDYVSSIWENYELESQHTSPIVTLNYISACIYFVEREAATKAWGLLDDEDGLLRRELQILINNWPKRGTTAIQNDRMKNRSFGELKQTLCSYLKV